jgi:hypothetical protein
MSRLVYSVDGTSSIAEIEKVSIARDCGLALTNLAYFRGLHLMPPSKPGQLEGNMAKRRFKHLGLGSFFGGFVYELIVLRDHFQVKFKQAIDWEAFVPILLPAYVGLAEERRPPYSPTLILKMLLITYLHNLSERQTGGYQLSALGQGIRRLGGG